MNRRAFLKIAPVALLTPSALLAVPLPELRPKSPMVFSDLVVGQKFFDGDDQSIKLPTIYWVLPGWGRIGKVNCYQFKHNRATGLCGCGPDVPVDRAGVVISKESLRLLVDSLVPYPGMDQKLTYEIEW